MKKIFSAIGLLFMVGASHATVDGNTRAYIVVQDINSEEFFVERVPLIGCWGVAQGPQLSQFTSEYSVNNLGCGDVNQKGNINYLTCAKLVKATESHDYMSFSEIELDISNCGAKNDPKFITMVRTAAKLNFPQRNDQNNKKTSPKEVKLTLIK